MTKYDDYDFHVADAIAHGQPPDNAFTHIALMLSWLIRHKLVLDEFCPLGTAHDLESGELHPNDLRDLVDGQLLSQMLTPDGVAFLDAYYVAGYLNDFAGEFSGAPEYEVRDGLDEQSRIDAVVDRAYGRWQSGAPPEAYPVSTASPSVAPPTGQPAAMFLGAAAVTVRDETTDPHADLELERRLSRALDQPLRVASSTAKDWGSSRLNRAIRDLGVSVAAVVVGWGLGPKSEPTIYVCRIPGVPQTRLAQVSVFHEAGPRNLVLPDRVIGAATAKVSEANVPGLLSPWTTIECCIDGYVVSVGSGLGSSSAEAVVLRLLKSLSDPT